MEKLVGKIMLGAFILILIVVLGAFFFIGMLKMAIYLIIMFLITFIFNITIKHADKFEMKLALGLNPETAYFRNLELFKFIIVWIIYLLVLVNFLPGLRSGINVIDFGWDTLTLCLHIFSSTVYTKNGQVRILYARHSEERKLIFPPGYFLSPAIWFRYRISNPMILSFSEGKLKIVPVEEEKPNENVFHFYKDDRLARLKSHLKGGAALFYNALLLNSQKIRFTEEWSVFRIGTSIFMALAINTFLYFTILNSYYSNISLNFEKMISPVSNKPAVESYNNSSGLSSNSYSSSSAESEQTTNRIESDETIKKQKVSENVAPIKNSTANMLSPDNKSIKDSSDDKHLNRVIRIVNPDGTKTKDFPWTKQGRREALQFLEDHNLNYEGLPAEKDLPE